MSPTRGIVRASVLFTTLFLLAGQDALAWGPGGHQVIGELALGAVSESTLAELQHLAGTADRTVLVEACTWPDQYRATEEGAWSAHQHYLNVPRKANGFEQGRDCPEGRCVAGAIARYAAELSDRSLEDEVRWRAWARVCHFIGDLHQPLHAGFGDDRGGNDTPVGFDGEEMSLHWFWDRALIEHNYPDWRLLIQDLAWRVSAPPSEPWTPAVIENWVAESHVLVVQRLYPESSEINREFAAASWLIALDQLSKAATRLTWVLESTLDQTN